MSTQDARNRLPREPYPGLRPFLDFEAALLFGRERQVREVIEHLRLTQFVAVLGGSGSGKSSLIHAGVMPELRSFGIPGAGDLWLPMTCTPGTNVSAADSAAKLQSPVTRLARRFASLLTSRGNEAADAQRIIDIANVFRQEAGFARLLDTYGAELAVPTGPNPADARVLFVLDQFEEIFHPTNKNVADASLLVERVLDHFFKPHPRCYVVLTMRSEHLNDCAAYLELPDAINKSSYLIRRLDPDELRGAITGPAQRFLRLVSRSDGEVRTLPEQVVFEEAVLERLLRDVQAITHDPDHLPLLQHLLARLWEAALERQDMDVPVPATITMADLVRAVNAAVRDEMQPLDDKLNTLRACVENWPETLYQWHDPAKRLLFDKLFSQLAFKDPNTGLYSQQRLDVDAAAQWLGPGMARADLRALIAEGFLGSVDYLFWDDEDPGRVTLKVSHESFIRGWARFRGLIDAESAQFDEFLGVLRKCADWSAGQRSEDFLLETGELKRLADSAFGQRLQQADKRNAWRRFLALDRDGVRLARHEPELDDFFGASTQRQADRQQRETRARQGKRWAVAITVLFALLPTALFAVFVQGPTMRRAELLFDAGNRANRATLNPSQSKVGDGANTLDSLLRAAELVEAARSGDDSLRMGVSQLLLKGLGSLPFFKDQRDFLASVFTQAEPPVNGTLRQLLTGAVWRAAPVSATAPETTQAQALAMPHLREDAGCFIAGAASETEPRGRLFIAPRRDGNAQDTRPLRALFVPLRKDRAVEIFGAAVDPVSGLCTASAVVLSSPEALDSRVVFDAGLRYFYYTVQGASSPLPSVIVQEIDWERGHDGQVRASQRQTLSIITDPEAVANVVAVAGPARVAVVPSWRVPGGRQVKMGEKWWRVVAAQAGRVEVSPKADELLALQASAPASACLSLAKSFADMPGFKLQHFESAQHCFLVARSGPLNSGDSSRPDREELRVAVHEKPLRNVGERTADTLPAPVAGLVPFARVATQESRPGMASVASPWFIGISGAHAGWLLLKVQEATGAERFIGLPWSTCALWRTGRSLQPQNAPVGGLQSGTSQACTDAP